MATDSSKKLTKFENQKTIVTADFANALFGGLYGTTEGDSLDSDDPRVAGHIHDGENADGHAQKIDLVDHVTNQLTNTNLADDAVTKRNVASFTDQSKAIPASEVIDGTTYYYLDIDEAGNTYGEISRTNVNGGTSSGDSLEAGAIEATLRFSADDGIDVALSDSGGIDTVKIKNIATNFGGIAISSSEAGLATGTSPLQADQLMDEVTFEAGFGMELDGSTTSDIVKFRSRFSMSQTVLHPDMWTAGPGAPTQTVRDYTDGDSDDLSYKYFRISGSEEHFVQVPIPQNHQGDQPSKFIFKIYCVVKDVTTAYIAAINPDPSFSVDLSVGSNENQTDNTNKGTIADDQDITASSNNLWTTAVTQLSTAVSDPEKMFVITWPEQELESGNNDIGILHLRINGNTNFGGGDHFDGAAGRAEVQLTNADIIWYF